ncbi:MAG: ATP-binding protein [Pseudomonadota bacterium]
MAADSKSALVADDWRLLQSLGLYRLLMVTLLVILQESGVIGELFEQVLSSLFFAACRGYALLALPLVLLSLYRRPGLTTQVILNFVVDVTAILILVYASGGVSAGLGMLLVPSVVGASLLLSMRLGLLAAATGTLAMFGQEIARQFPHLFSPSDFTATGVLGVMFFVTATAASAVARRARTSEALARQVGSEFADLSRLNEVVLDTLQTGVAVVDSDDQLRALNPAAIRLLGAEDEPSLMLVSPGVAEALARWRAGSASPEPPIAPAREGGLEVLARFRRLGSAVDSPVLILLEDAARIRDQAQQIKLAALGRLSASIAHEIRNPLAAITHAGQLLAESPALEAPDRRLIDIVQRHGKRIDTIVKDVLDLSRGAANPQTFVLLPWLEQMLAQYCEAHAERFATLDCDSLLQVRFDPHHLQQVLFNLLDNAWLHGRVDASASPNVRIHARALYVQGGALEISDDGPGVPAEIIEQLFEPFFTTEAQGTGLGLYLARELCTYNQAKLSHHRGDAGGATFRITFVAPDATL